MLVVKIEGIRWKCLNLAPTNLETHLHWEYFFLHLHASLEATIPTVFSFPFRSRHQFLSARSFFVTHKQAVVLLILLSLSWPRLLWFIPCHSASSHSKHSQFQELSPSVSLLSPFQSDFYSHLHFELLSSRLPMACIFHCIQLLTVIRTDADSSGRHSLFQKHHTPGFLLTQPPFSFPLLAPHLLPTCQIFAGPRADILSPFSLLLRDLIFFLMNFTCKIFYYHIQLPHPTIHLICLVC